VSNRILLIRKKTVGHFGGRELLSDLNSNSLKCIFGRDFFSAYISYKTSNRYLYNMLSIFGYIDGVSFESIKNIYFEIIKKNISEVFVDGSNYGVFIRHIKKKFPLVRVTCFFHNVEYVFFKHSFSRRPSVRRLFIMLANYIAERASINYSDRIITLTKRDSNILFDVYGRKAEYICPLSIKDMYSTSLNYEFTNHPKTALFVGSDFFANVVGINWFIENVLPKVNIRLVIVGRGLSSSIIKSLPGKDIHILGTVKDIAPCYASCNFVVAPILDGSGMKTKIAEALMFGKKVIGTAEAFVGYEDYADKIGFICGSVDDYVRAIEKFSDVNYYPELRCLYKKYFSASAHTARLRKIY